MSTQEDGDLSGTITSPNPQSKAGTLVSLAYSMREYARGDILMPDFRAAVFEAAAYLNSPRSDDPYDLNRFVRAQEDDYERALTEIRSGKKRTHWMWYIFPQIDGLGRSATSTHYAIKSIREAVEYLGHPILGPRLLECAEAVLRVDGRSATELFGSPDDLKLQSCATLFACVSDPGSVFDRVLTKYYRGEHDAKTRQLLDLPPQGR